MKSIFTFFILNSSIAFGTSPQCNGEMADVFFNGYKEGLASLEAQNTKFKGNSALWAGQMRSRASEVGGYGPVEEGVLTQEDGSPVKLAPSSQALNCRRAGYHLAELMFLKDKRLKGSPPCNSGISGTQMGLFLGTTLCALEGPLEKAPKLLQGDTSLAKTCNQGFSIQCKKEVASVLSACSGGEPISLLATQLTFQFCGAPLTP